MKYTSTSRPSDITLCHCRACQQLSGSAFLPFTQVSKEGFEFVSSSTLKLLKLSEFAERTFCTSCGSPITMAYHFEPGSLALTMASVDLDSIKGTKPSVEKHIFLEEKAPWMVLPDDGVKRHETSSFADRLVPQPNSKVSSSEEH